MLTFCSKIFTKSVTQRKKLRQSGIGQARTSSTTKTLTPPLWGVLGVSALMLVGCSKPVDEESKVAAKQVGQTNTVVIYSARKEQMIRPLLDAFTRQTGIATKLVTDKEGPLLARLKAEGKNSPADMLLTVDALNLWQAAEAGLLQPVQSEVLADNVPNILKDPENKWFGLSIHVRTVFYNPKTIYPDDIKSYENLASPAFAGKLCLQTSKKVYSQSLVAMLIAHHGEEKAEQIVRGWVANLATDIFPDDAKLLRAIEVGRCQVGIANSYYYGRMVADNRSFGVGIYWPNQAASGDMLQGVHVGVSGAGVTKYAPNPLKAKQLIEWLSQPEAQGIYSAQDKEYPANPAVAPSVLLASWGGFKQDTINVSEAGRLQADAVRLMDRAGYR